MRYASADEVMRVVRDAGVDFPASKEELVRAAEAAGAPDDVVAALRAIPPEEYANRAEVARSIPADPASDLGLSPGQRAQQARQGRRHHPQGVSQHLRDVPKPALDEEGQRTKREDE